MIIQELKYLDLIMHKHICSSFLLYGIDMIKGLVSPKVESDSMILLTFWYKCIKGQLSVLWEK